VVRDARFSHEKKSYACIIKKRIKQKQIKWSNAEIFNIIGSYLSIIYSGTHLINFIKNLLITKKKKNIIALDTYIRY